MSTPVLFAHSITFWENKSTGGMRAGVSTFAYLVYHIRFWDGNAPTGMRGSQTVLGMSKTVRIHVFTTLWPVGNVKSFQMLCDELELRRCFRPKCMASMAAVFLFSTCDHGNDY
ncbi:hypothetical protein T4E_10353 [Trichinella pseudospiralis]|uniref:Uncharacterized protein n=1 Tax=Trichinella pseudospiralis TaxID=6337 RepID=A0A0V0XZQ6_TRIPS|nr:hypothetical protein T4E_10353 [Trichinella pseudospiralis]